LALSPSQFRKFVVSVQLMLQLPALHAAVEWLPAGCAGQVTPHVPQLASAPEGDAAPSLRLTSQPFAALPSQSAYGFVHVSPQRPTVHDAVECAPDGQLCPHEPQFIEFVVVFTSQPFTEFPSQSAVPGGHMLIPQTPNVHTGVSIDPVGTVQTCAQAPQFMMSA